MNKTDHRPLVTVKEAAEYLGLTTRRVYTLVEQGALPCVRIGIRTIRLDPNVVDRFVDDRRSR